MADNKTALEAIFTPVTAGSHINNSPFAPEEAIIGFVPVTVKTPAGRQQVQYAIAVHWPETDEDEADTYVIARMTQHGLRIKSYLSVATLERKADWSKRFNDQVRDAGDDAWLGSDDLAAVVEGFVALGKPAPKAKASRGRVARPSLRRSRKAPVEPVAVKPVAARPAPQLSIVTDDCNADDEPVAIEPVVAEAEADAESIETAAESFDGWTKAKLAKVLNAYGVAAQHTWHRDALVALAKAHVQ